MLFWPNATADRRDMEAFQKGISEGRKTIDEHSLVKLCTTWRETKYRHYEIQIFKQEKNQDPERCKRSLQLEKRNIQEQRSSPTIKS